MSWYIYDTEVFRHDWLAVFKKFEEDEWHIMPNDGEALQDFIADHPDDAFIGFNSKAYDQFIIKGIMAGMSPEQLKKLNDYLIEGFNGWQYPDLPYGSFIRFNNVDIRDDMQQGLSLKAIEGHMGMSIEQSSVPFDIQMPLTKAEMDETIHYCKHDVLATEMVVKARMKYLQTKIDIGKMVNLSQNRALSMTNAKLTAALLGAKATPHNDERDYSVPDNLLREYIPDEVMAFFARIHDPSVKDEQLFKSKLNIKIGDCKVTLGYGGIHGSQDNYIWKEGETIE